MGWCLPAPSDILELWIQETPTRGGTDGTVHRDGRACGELHAGSNFRKGPEAEGFSDFVGWPMESGVLSYLVGLLLWLSVPALIFAALVLYRPEE